jgi:hypothetical protein
MQTFYTSLFKMLASFSTSRAIPHFWMIAPDDQHMGAVVFGNLPFSHQMAFVAGGVNYVASLWKMDNETQEFYQQSNLFSPPSFSQSLSSFN